MPMPREAAGGVGGCGDVRKGDGDGGALHLESDLGGREGRVLRLKEGEAGGVELREVEVATTGEDDGRDGGTDVVSGLTTCAVARAKASQ